MMRMRASAMIVSGVAAILSTSGQAMAQATDVVEEMNELALDVKLTDASKSWRTLFDAAIELTDAPTETGGATAEFNLLTIHPGMSNWTAVSDWAESNGAMADAILACKDKKGLGLPYGLEIDQKYISNGVFADLAVEGDLAQQNFAYLDVLETVAAFATAETYRLFEAGQTQRAIDLALAHIFVLDQVCDREYLLEKSRGVHLLSESLSVLRDMMHAYFDSITIEQFSASEYETSEGEKRKGISFELPWLRLDLLQMPTGERVTAKAIIESVFDGDLPNPDRFSETFGRIQAHGAPLTQFGAAKRWRLVAAFHGSLLATQDHLNLVYDDWWRRWSIRAWDDLLDISTQYSRTNPIRYAAVTFSLRDLSDLFTIRRELVASANGTALAAGLCGYRKRYGSDPNDLEKIYAVYVQKRNDLDPYDREGGVFGYRLIPESDPLGIVADGYDDFINVTGGVLWSRGADYDSDRGESHSADGLTGDIVFWPPIRALAREQGHAN